MKTTTIASLLLLAALAPGCVDDGGAKVNAKRGVPADAAGADKAAAPAKPKSAATEPEGEADADLLPSQLPARPPVALDSKSFGRRRDPFLNAVVSDVVVPEPTRQRADRKVEMGQYAFEDLKLIAIVNAGPGMRPRALFVASDGHSGAVEQGKYFSSAEVLLAAVNRDYVEIEVVDDDLASSLNLQRGERRAIYLRNE